MKRQLLLSFAVMLGASLIAQDQLPDPGDREKVRYSKNLTLEWYGSPVGTAAAYDPAGGPARAGIGVNGKFYVVMQNIGVAVYNKDGQIKTIENPTTWVSINVDDAGHVYFRNDKGGWPGNAGNFNGENAQFCVIDSKTDEIIKYDVPLSDSHAVRFDELPHIYGNMVNDFIEMPIPTSSGTTTGLNFMYDKLIPSGSEDIDFGTSIKAGGFPSPANKVQTLGQAQLYSPDEDGFFSLAALSNNYNNPAEYPGSCTASWWGWGNNIALYKWVEDGDVRGYEFTGKWFNTPSHSAVSGFCMFSYAGKNYICYPAGTTPSDGYPSGDGFFVMEEELVDSPQNMTLNEPNSDWDKQIHKAAAYKYATEGIKSGNNYRGINVEPVAGEDGKFTIYLYDPYFSMQVWTLDLTDYAGINDIVADKGAAKIFGGIGVVIVDGAAKAQVYSIDGALVAEGAGSIAVPAGVYVVKAGTTAAKVIVK